AKTEAKTEAPAKAPMTKEEKELWQKVSYAVGMSIGESWKTGGVDFDMTEVSQAVNDIMGGKKTKLSKKEAQDAIGIWQKKIMEESEKKKATEGAANKKKGADFRAANAKKEGVITTASGLQ